MKFNKWIAAAAITSFFISCGENSSKDENKDNRDTITTVTTNPSTDVISIDVPEATRTTFKEKYPAATNVSWRRYEPIDWFDWSWAGWPVLDSNDYVVSYTDNGSEYWSWYDDQNRWIGTTTMVANHSSLPAPVSKAIDANFSGYTILSVQKENDKDRTAYEIKLEKGTDKAKLLVDENGKVLKKTTKIDGEKTKEKNT